MLQRLSIKTHPIRFLVVAVTVGYLAAIGLVWYSGEPENDLMRQLLTTLGNGWMAIIIYYFGTTDRTGGSGTPPPSQTVVEKNVEKTTTVQQTTQQGE